MATKMIIIQCYAFWVSNVQPAVCPTPVNNGIVSRAGKLHYKSATMRGTTVFLYRILLGTENACDRINRNAQMVIERYHSVSHTLWTQTYHYNP